MLGGGLLEHLRYFSKYKTRRYHCAKKGKLLVKKKKKT